MAKIRAAIDIGSNSTLLLIANVFDDEQFDVLESEARVTGLGRELDLNGVFTQESMNDTFDAIKEYIFILKKHGIDPSSVIATATEASRVAKNAKKFYSKVKNELGVNVQVITTEAEAYYSTRGILLGNKIESTSIVIMDIGGASTELITVDPKTQKIKADFSMPIGAVRATEWICLNSFEEKVSDVVKSNKANLEAIETDCLYCVAGTMTSVGAMVAGLTKFQEEKVHGLEIPVNTIQNLYREIENLSSDEILVKFPFLGKRSTSISGGLRTACTIFEFLGIKTTKISTLGLRYGTLIEGEIKDGFIS